MNNGTEFVNDIFARSRNGSITRHEHKGVDGPKHIGMAELGLGLIKESGMAAWLEPPRLFPGQLLDIDRFWVQGAIYMDDCLNITPTTANAGFKHRTRCSTEL